MSIMGLTAMAFSAIALSGCYAVTSYPDQPAMTSQINKSMDSIVVSIKWHDSVDEVEKACAGVQKQKTSLVYGCARFSFDGGVKCIIDAIPPKDFNDVPLLAVLGHELVHCFMGTHA